MMRCLGRFFDQLDCQAVALRRLDGGTQYFFLGGRYFVHFSDRPCLLDALTYWTILFDLKKRCQALSNECICPMNMDKAFDWTNWLSF
jgi:hypothetical protein